jgi:hypothetical protein
MSSRLAPMPITAFAMKASSFIVRQRFAVLAIKSGIDDRGHQLDDSDRTALKLPPC